MQIEHCIELLLLVVEYLGLHLSLVVDLILAYIDEVYCLVLCVKLILIGYELDPCCVHDNIQDNPTDQVEDHEAHLFKYKRLRVVAIDNQE